MILANTKIVPFTGSRAAHKLWLAEAIWGHRIERQSTSGLLLEFLSMAEGMHRQGKLLEHELGYASYMPYLSTQLRNLLFNNPSVEDIAQESGNDEEAWHTWLTRMREVAVVEKESQRDFAYLRERFDSFQSLVDLIALLRNITLDPATTRGWTYMLLFPIGPTAFYDERSLKRGKEGFERTRTVFTRTGELAYLMLSRARNEFRTEIANFLSVAFEPTAPKNRLLLRLINGGHADLGEEKSGTYLPYATHPAFDRMAQDVLALFRLNLPGADTFAHLGPLLAFHLLLYQFESANAILGRDGLPALICEILSPRPNLVRRAAVASHNDNESLGAQAVERYIEQLLGNDEELSRVLADEHLSEVDKCEVLKDRIKALFALDQQFDGTTLEQIRTEFLRIARKAYTDAAGDAVRSLSTQCGLASGPPNTGMRLQTNSCAIWCMST